MEGSRQARVLAARQELEEVRRELAERERELKEVEEQIVQATEALEATEEWQRLEALRREREWRLVRIATGLLDAAERGEEGA